ncbi:MAG: hypothetical protein OEW04_12150 [Nitrospirota bacterium]|nr:hypothetical protein [Nitrospirota bacterium]
MGILDKLFGGGKEYPALESTNPAASRLNKFQPQLVSLTKQVSDSLEVVPGEDAAYIFVGKPPKAFGIAWIQDGKLHNFKSIAQEKGIPATEFQLLSDELREAYQRSEDAGRYTSTIDGRKILVTPSDSLAHDVKEILEKVVH